MQVFNQWQYFDGQMFFGCYRLSQLLGYLTIDFSYEIRRLWNTANCAAICLCFQKLAR